MQKLPLIEKKLSAYRARCGQECQGDHLLTPDWQTPPPPYRDAAVLIALLPRGDDLSVVFTQRTSHLTAHAGQVSFPGGGVEAQDYDAAATALREAEEEIGLPRESVRILGQLDDYITGTGFLVRPVVGFVSEIPVWKPDDFEVAEIFDVPLSHLSAPGCIFQRSREFRGIMRHFYACDWEKFHIWGATAGMLKNFLDVIDEGDK
ncbi:MAG: CoA pyrophosphatase [Bdellovibrionales bacterium]|jgi:8-oxo-dGTP pyrophosphatase MutT (NUDIX family)|nr:CoA pyrophosphatase [Bdellovibrionales bacterium]